MFFNFIPFYILCDPYIYFYTIWLFARYLRVTELAHRNKNNNCILPSIISAHLYFSILFTASSSHLIEVGIERVHSHGVFSSQHFRTFHPGRVSLIIFKLVKLSDELDTGELGQWPAQVSQSEKWKWFLLRVTRADSQQSGWAPAEKLKVKRWKMLPFLEPKILMRRGSLHPGERAHSSRYSPCCPCDERAGTWEDWGPIRWECLGHVI